MAPPNVIEISFVATISNLNVAVPSCFANLKFPSSIVFCNPYVAPHNVNDVSCVAIIKHECRSSIFGDPIRGCSAQCAGRFVCCHCDYIKRISTGSHLVVLCSTE